SPTRRSSCLLVDSLSETLPWQFLAPRHGEFYGPHDALVLLHVNQLICRNILQSIHMAAGPPDLQLFNSCRFPQTKMDPQITLRQVTSATSHFVNLRLCALPIGRASNAFQAGANPAAIRFRANRPYLDPIVIES